MTPDVPLSPRRFARLVWRALADFYEHQGFSQAAALAYYALLSFIPLLFLLIAAAGMALGDVSEIRSLVDDQLRDAVPWFQDFLHEQINRLIDQAPGLGLLSLGGMIWTSGLFFSALQACLHAPWFAAGERLGRWRHALPWMVGPALCLLLIVVMLLVHAWSWAPARLAPVAGLSPGLWSWLGLALLIWSLYVLLLPSCCPYAFSLAVSLVLAGASKGVTLLFTSLITHLPNYYVIYGSLAGAVLFLLWLDYNMMLILWGAHLIRLWHRTKRNIEAV